MVKECSLCGTCQHNARRKCKKPPEVGPFADLLGFADGVIARLGKSSVEGARHAIRLCQKPAFRFGRLFVFDLSPFALTTGKYGFAEIHASIPEAGNFDPRPVASQQAKVFPGPEGDALPVLID